jgi:hypothetical protein
MCAPQAIFAALCLVIFWTADAAAVDFSFDGYVDVRLIMPSKERSWLDGGLGKLRYGSDQANPDLRVAEAVGQAVVKLTPDFEVVSVFRLEPEQRTGLDVIETYAAWRPPPAGSWQWSIKAGAFLPGLSLENTDLGWTSPYTITPSAINSWIGEELRTIGSEGTLTHHSGWGSFAVIGAIYCCNEPTGTLIADRGWALGDRPTGLLERVRDPDATITLSGEGTPPGRIGLFENIDGHVGWYGGLTWEASAVGKLAVVRYDNDANPFAVTSRDEAWHTRFWSASFKTRIEGVTVLAQGLTGDTSVGYDDGLSITRFNSAFVLASYDVDDWRISARADVFQSRNYPSLPIEDEDGHAFTTALFWNTREWLRLGAEFLVITSRRPERVLDGGLSEQTDNQIQLDAQVSL